TLKNLVSRYGFSEVKKTPDHLEGEERGFKDQSGKPKTNRKRKTEQFDVETLIQQATGDRPELAPLLQGSKKDPQEIKGIIESASLTVPQDDLEIISNAIMGHKASD